MNAAFLDRLAEQLRSRRSPACRRAIGRILSNGKSGWEEGKYYDEAEADEPFESWSKRNGRVEALMWIT
jgi:hypothetical protein